MNVKNAGRKRNLAKPAAGRKAQQNRQKQLQNAQKTAKLISKTPPKYLMPAAKSLWRKLVPDLNELGILTVLDQPNLETLVINYAMLLDATDSLQRLGAVYMDEHGASVKNPAVNVIDTASRNIRSLGSSLGMDANARSQLLDTHPANENAQAMLEAMLNG